MSVALLDHIILIRSMEEWSVSMLLLILLVASYTSSWKVPPPCPFSHSFIFFSMKKDCDKMVCKK